MVVYDSEAQGVGSRLISFDDLHSNDAGYDLWGRYIAEEIINEWK
jgi:lysophospholipase L1-like esterase